MTSSPLTQDPATAEATDAVVGAEDEAAAAPSVDPPTLAPPPASPWSDGFARVAVRSAQVLLIHAVTVVLVYAMIRLRLVVVPVLVAILLAAAVGPVVGALSRRGLPRVLGTSVAMLTGVVVIGGVGWLVVNGVRGEWDELTTSAAEGLAELQRYLQNGPIPVDEQQLTQARDAVVDLLKGDQFRTGAVAGAAAAAEVVTGLLLALIVLFYLVKDGPEIWAFLLSPVSPVRQRRLQIVGERSVKVLGGYVRGTSIVALVDAVLIGVALVVLGVPLALPLSLVVFLGAFIPLVGAVVAGVLAALVALVANGPVVALIVLGVVVAVNQIEGNVLAPFVLGRALSLHPLVILLALTAGTLLAGIIGALLSVPVAAVAWTAISSWTHDKQDVQDALAREDPDTPQAAGPRTADARTSERRPTRSSSPTGSTAV